MSELFTWEHVLKEIVLNPCHVAALQNHSITVRFHVYLAMLRQHDASMLAKRNP